MNEVKVDIANQINVVRVILLGKPFEGFSRPKSQYHLLDLPWLQYNLGDKIHSIEQLRATILNIWKLDTKYQLTPKPLFFMKCQIIISFDLQLDDSTFINATNSLGNFC